MHTVLLLAFALGLKHSSDADHVVAVSGLLSSHASSHNRDRFSAARIGALWGLGHLLALFTAGGLLIAFRMRMAARAEWALELLVAVVLIGLGVNTLRKCFAGRFHFHVHRHGGRSHAHLHFHEAGASHEHNAHALAHAQDYGPQTGLQPMLIGIAHGLAGTAGLALLVLASISSQLVGLLYLLSFGLGALVGMVLFSVLVNLPLSAAASAARREAWLGGIQLLAGTANAAFGAFLVYRSLLPHSWPF